VALRRFDSTVHRYQMSKAPPLGNGRKDSQIFFCFGSVARKNSIIGRDAALTNLSRGKPLAARDPS
jgi:hypothetical protein